MSIPPDVATSVQEPASEGEAVEECFTPEVLLAIAREQAARLDPRHRALYASLPPERFYHSADLVAAWLVAVQEHLDRRGRGRREYGATVRHLAESTNEVELACALAWTHIAYRVLPGRIPPRKKRAGDAG
jgi:hypothetical protein